MDSWLSQVHKREVKRSLVQNLNSSKGVHFYDDNRYAMLTPTVLME